MQEDVISATLIHQLTLFPSHGFYFIFFRLLASRLLGYIGFFIRVSPGQLNGFSSFFFLLFLPPRNLFIRNFAFCLHRTSIYFPGSRNFVLSLSFLDTRDFTFLVHSTCSFCL